MVSARNRFSGRYGKPTFHCLVCKRRTRETGQGVDHLCEDCYEISGIDNAINDNGYDVTQYSEELKQRLAHIAKLGGDIQSVLENNTFAFPLKEKN